jgi:t-SNARE complex subunit (syntaxin)
MSINLPTIPQKNNNNNNNNNTINDGRKKRRKKVVVYTCSIQCIAIAFCLIVSALFFFNAK